MRNDRTTELNNMITKLAGECRLNGWNSFVDEMQVPGDMYPALASNRPELIKLIQPRALTAEEAKPLFDIIATLIATNSALRQHAEQLAHFTDIWADSFKALHSVGNRIKHFAHFEPIGGDED